MDNKAEYQLLYSQIMDIRNSHKKLIEKNNELISVLRNTLLIDSHTFKENELELLITDESRLIEEIDDVILPIIKQKMM